VRISTGNWQLETGDKKIARELSICGTVVRQTQGGAE